MKAIIYYLLLPFIYIIAWLPFSILYLKSDFLRFILYNLLGYRKEVVQTNLRNAFPQKSQNELHKIEKDFYQFFCDLIFETIKTLSITPKQVLNRVDLKGTSLFQKYYDKKQSVIVVMGHFGNWELAGARFSQESVHTLYVIYHPLQNKYFDKLLYHMRTRLGNKLYSRKEAIKGMLADRNKITATAFIADQTPSPKFAYWTKFLNQDTPVFTGTAKISKKLNYPIIYVSITRPKRGYYHAQAELLIEDPADLTENEISEMHTRRLEQDIQENPHIWLWTHRRWKHKKPE